MRLTHFVNAELVISGNKLNEAVPPGKRLCEGSSLGNFFDLMLARLARNR